MQQHGSTISQFITSSLEICRNKSGSIAKEDSLLCAELAAKCAEMLVSMQAHLSSPIAAEKMAYNVALACNDCGAYDVTLRIAKPQSERLEAQLSKSTKKAAAGLGDIAMLFLGSSVAQVTAMLQVGQGGVQAQEVRCLDFCAQSFFFAFFIFRECVLLFFFLKRKWDKNGITFFCRLHSISPMKSTHQL